jgi:hypothetical protein
MISASGGQPGVRKFQTLVPFLILTIPLTPVLQLTEHKLSRRPGQILDNEENHD